MVKIEREKNLKSLNTFMVPAVARYFASVQNEDEAREIFQSDEWQLAKERFVLGGGSNILFTRDIDGFVLKNEIRGREVLDENDEEVVIRVGAGESWHDFVMWSVERDLWGIENLVYIPGTVGAAPVQNIGAYGVEAKSTIQKVEYIDLEDFEENSIDNRDCEFAYRDSIFKKNPGKYFITHVVFKLHKKGEAVANYGRVAEALEEKDIQNPNSKDIAEIIMEIRKSKLPEIGEIGTAGSFFKNPIISQEAFEKIRENFPEVRYFALENDLVKIPAGWLLDELGYKGFMQGHVGNYKNHALIIVHDGEGTGQEVYEHVQNIMQRVKEVFGIALEPEVNIL